MNKRVLPRQMWWLFVFQIIVAACMTATGIAALSMMLYSATRTNAETRRMALATSFQIQTEQRIDNLRQEALALARQGADTGMAQENTLRVMIEISAIYGAGLFAFSFAPAFCAYKLQRQVEKTETPVQA
jgi:hypothetical protein